MISINELRARAAKFANEWKDAEHEQADKQTFWNEFFEIFDVPRKSVAVYEKAVDKLSGAKGFIDLYWPGTLIVEHKSLGKPLDKAYDQAADYASFLSPAEHPRYIITSDFRRFRLYDLATLEKQSEWDISLKELPQNIHLFSFIAGYKKQEIVEEDPVNRRAAEQLAELHDILKDSKYTGHDLEVFLVRILFCLFAEDSGVFEKNQFHNFIYDRTEIDGSNVGPQLNQFFEVLNTPREKRQTNLDETIASLPYVNGNLFAERIATPNFNYKMRDILLNSSHKLNWSLISPAIFGAMFQGVMDPKQRRSLGAHYTSEQNILKVIKPLFLDKLWGEFEEAKDNPRVLKEFHNKLASRTFMDPACGCGNFLVVTYREIRRLELELLKVQHGNLAELGVDFNLEDIVECNVDQFYGIELEEFPAQIAQVALWLTDVQMNNEAAETFGKPLVRLPLTHSPTIMHGDALELDWSKLIEPSKLNYLFGNPPFSGGKQMSQDQRDQVVSLFPKGIGAGLLDFVAGWYAKAIDYIQGRPIDVAFVSTNSITQGEQVGILWRYLLKEGAVINFAHRTFKWSNEAGGQAAVHCVVVGFSLFDRKHKIIFDYPAPNSEAHAVEAKHINPYLVDAPDILPTSRSKPLEKDVPEMIEGITALDKGSYLRFTEAERDELIKQEPAAEKWMKPWLTGQGFFNNEKRYCLWMVGITPAELRAMPKVMERVKKVKAEREKSDYSKKFADRSWLFRETQIADRYLIFPKTSSENRFYIPIGFIENAITSNTALILPNATLYHFGILTSQMHMAWMKAVAGRLESRYRYSKDIVYNNFVWPKVDNTEQARVEELAQNILDCRIHFPESTLADMYDPLTMPPTLLKAHQTLDRVVDRLYSKGSFESDTDRVAFLFQKYVEQIAK